MLYEVITFVRVEADDPRVLAQEAAHEDRGRKGVVAILLDRSYNFV